MNQIWILLGPFLSTLSHLMYGKLSELQLWTGLMVNFRSMSNTNILPIYVKKIVTQNWMRTLTLIGLIENNKRSQITSVSMLFTITLELRQMNLFTRSYRNNRLSITKRNSSFHGTSCCCHFHYMRKPWSSTCEFSETCKFCGDNFMSLILFSRHWTRIVLRTTSLDI